MSIYHQFIVFNQFFLHFFHIQYNTGQNVRGRKSDPPMHVTLAIIKNNYTSFQKSFFPKPDTKL